VIRAFLDESESNRGKDPHAYLVGAAVLLEEHVAEVCARIATLKLPGQAKLHWRDESDRRQRVIIRTIGAMPVEAVLAVHVDPRRRPEARRHRALRSLLPELAALGVSRLDVESRGPKADLRDRALLDQMRRSRMFDTAQPPMRMDHPVGRAQPGLWLADSICGAVVAARCGDGRHTEALGTRLRIIEAP